MTPSDKPFGKPEHQPFHWQRGSDAALLIHGFPGTPAEMRPVGLLLRDAGWTVDGPLLPGFGPDVKSLADRKFGEWIRAARESCARIMGMHDRVLIVGNSMGGALALTVAEEARPAGLVLLAPFTRFASRWHNFFWPVIRRLLRQVHPFQKADFSSAEIRRVIGRMFKDADPDDAEVQRTIRALSLPIGALDQLRKAGLAALAAAPRVKSPCLILQGLNDPIVIPATTQALVRRLPGQARYVELDAGHDLIEPDGNAWPEVTRLVADFAGLLKQ